MSTITQATAGQVKQTKRIGSDAVEDAIDNFLDEMDPDKLGIQRVIEQGNEFTRAIRVATLVSLMDLSCTGNHKDEEVLSDFTYPKEYDDPKPIEDQVLTLTGGLSTFLCRLDPTHALEYAKNLPELPGGAKGWFAILSDTGLKKLFSHITDSAERYCAGVRFVHERLKANRRFHNYRNGQIWPNNLRVHTRTAHMLDLIAENQPGDILIVAGQLGMRHSGRSVHRARKCFNFKEFGLGSLAVGSILLTHPNLLVHLEELGIDCPGDEFDDPNADGGCFARSPLFRFDDGELVFGTRRNSLASEGYGSGTAFVSQS